ncbi:EndoU domain-containing protein, partial [Clostridium sporogenes]|uniref:EndoU domain-containing protein n=2 Tax=Clostridium sporogenes TaxID=1509 RepID=UPI00313C2C64
KGLISGGKAATINSLDDIARYGLNSLDDIIEKAGIQSVDDLARIGVTSAEDLSKLGVNSVDDLAKLGINNIDELRKLGISSEELSKVGIKTNFENEIPLTGEEWNEFLSEKYGPENVTWETKELSNPKLFKVSDSALNHSSIGDFTYNPKTGKVSKMKGGGHGQANIDFLDANGLKYEIVDTYPNGVRVGNVEDHKVKAKRTGNNQSWFPKNWTESDIVNAGEYVGNLKENINAADGVISYGEVNGVRVGVIRTNGQISTVFPDATMQP